MTTATRPRARRTSTGADTSNPLRPKALSYYRDCRLLIGKVQWDDDSVRPAVIRARIAANPNAPGGSEVRFVERSEKTGWVWTCTLHTQQAACSCRLSVQMFTGWEHLGGRAA
ncbi:hypothetical protein CcI49_23060 [Frankia sp. CcI49]|uniref:hypothetical protein n=1 Tax=Frankia sp. CcI49 TaxID=1745382 RepID=UPI0009765C41|nr:hypothetical protein [Frankia sp. CcI49]ONH58338.1 hypothetical protein CcI49_23060 [Frankia sp. CcI49]